MAEKMPESIHHDRSDAIRSCKMAFHYHINEVCGVFEGAQAAQFGNEQRDRFLEALKIHQKDQAPDYLTVIQSLPEAVSKAGTLWLEAIVQGLCTKAGTFLEEQ